MSGLHRGRGAFLVVRGEAGTGKTALLDYATTLDGGVRVIRVAGAQAEASLPYAGLHQLCGSMTSLLGRLPGPQRIALETAFGLHAGAPADRFLVGLGALRLLGEAASDGPLLCAIDDAHWLDQASAEVLAFVAGRLRAERVLVIAAAREPLAALAGLPEMVIGGLNDEDARALLAAAVPWPLDERVREQLVAEARAGPRAGRGRR